MYAREVGEEVVSGLEGRLAELFAAETPVERSAALLVERLAGWPVPPGLARIFAAAGSVGRARAVAEAVGRLEPGGVCALSFAADVASQVDGAPARAGLLLEQARAAASDAEQQAGLAEHFFALGRLVETLELLTPQLVADPGDEEAEELYAEALQAAHGRMGAWFVGGDEADFPAGCPCGSGRSWADCCRLSEQAVLEAFDDRGEFDALCGAVAAYLEDSPLRARVAARVAAWLAELEREEGAGDPDLEVGEWRGEELEALYQLGLEHAWLVAGDEDEDEDEQADDDEQSPLGLFAADPATPAVLAAAARRWLEQVRYGLWQVADPDPAPGVWCTEILTGVRRYAAIPAEQLAEVGRWGVLMGALVPVGPVWRTGGAVVSLRPSEADLLAGLVKQMAETVLAALAGRRPRRRRLSPGRQRPYGVLVHQLEPAPAFIADVYGKVVGGGLARLVGMLRGWRAAGPRLANSDGDPLCLISALLAVADPDALGRRLAAHPDFEREEDGLSWWGRQLTPMEQAGALAEIQARLPAEDAAAIEGPTRWLRGHLRIEERGLRVELNSRERLDRLVEVVRELGERPLVSEQTVFDPALDLPPLRRGAPLPFGASAEATAAWLSQWPDEPLPALGGQSPRRAAARPAQRALVEALLRDFEHDADQLSRHGQPAPDLAALRAELDMPADAWR